MALDMNAHVDRVWEKDNNQRGQRRPHREAFIDVAAGDDARPAAKRARHDQGQSRPLGFADLPPELVVYILASFCRMGDLSRLTLVCQWLYSIASDPIVQKRVYDRMLPPCADKRTCVAYATDVVDPAFLTEGFDCVGMPRDVTLAEQLSQAIADGQPPEWMAQLGHRVASSCAHVAGLLVSSSKGGRTASPALSVCIRIEGQYRKNPPRVDAVPPPQLSFSSAHKACQHVPSSIAERLGWGAAYGLTRTRNATRCETWIGEHTCWVSTPYAREDGARLYGHFSWEHDARKAERPGCEKGGPCTVSVVTDSQTYDESKFAMNVRLADSTGVIIYILAEAPLDPPFLAHQQRLDRTSWMAVAIPPLHPVGDSDNDNGTNERAAVAVLWRSQDTVTCGPIDHTGKYETWSFSTISTRIYGRGFIRSQASGSVYRGVLNGSVQFGKGNVTTSAGATVCKGEWFDGVLAGYGTLYKLDGTLLYRGWLKDGMPSDAGTLFVGGYVICAKGWKCATTLNAGTSGSPGDPSGIARIRPRGRGHVITPDGTRLECKWSRERALPLITRVHLPPPPYGKLGLERMVIDLDKDETTSSSPSTAISPGRRSIDLTRPPIASLALEAEDLLECREPACDSDDDGDLDAQLPRTLRPFSPEAMQLSAGRAVPRHTSGGILPEPIAVTPRQRISAQRRLLSCVSTPAVGTGVFDGDQSARTTRARVDQWLAASLARSELCFRLDLTLYGGPTIEVNPLQAILTDQSCPG